MILVNSGHSAPPNRYNHEITSDSSQSSEIVKNINIKRKMKEVIINNEIGVEKAGLVTQQEE